MRHIPVMLMVFLYIDSLAVTPRNLWYAAIRASYRVLFSPKDDVKSELLRLIMAERREIKAAIYSITNRDIVDALIRKRKQGVGITIITDRRQLQSEWSKVRLLARNNIVVYVYPPTDSGPLMHHKFALFASQECCVTGSVNWSDAAMERNQENFLLTNDPGLYHQYYRRFEEIRKGLQPLRCA